MPTRAPRVRHGSDSEEGRETPDAVPAVRDLAVFLGSVWPNFRTPQGSPWLETAPWRSFQPGRFLTVRIQASLAPEDHESPTSCRPCAASRRTPHVLEHNGNNNNRRGPAPTTAAPAP